MNKRQLSQGLTDELRVFTVRLYRNFGGLPATNHLQTS
jgi:hypothetical protein